MGVLALGLPWRVKEQRCWKWSGKAEMVTVSCRHCRWEVKDSSRRSGMERPKSVGLRLIVAHIEGIGG